MSDPFRCFGLLKCQTQIQFQIVKKTKNFQINCPGTFDDVSLRIKKNCSRWLHESYTLKLRLRKEKNVFYENLINDRSIDQKGTA